MKSDSVNNNVHFIALFHKGQFYMLQPSVTLVPTLVFFQQALTFSKEAFLRYILAILLEIKGEKNENAVRFSREFNGSQNQGYLHAASLVGRKEGNSYWVEKEL